MTALLDAAASVVDEIGYERLTTAMVAEKAGASIGTVYRYFPDRIAVLQALSARTTGEFSVRVEQLFSESSHGDWLEAFTAAIDELVLRFRTVPGFKSLRFGDVLDVRPRESAETYYGVVAGTVSKVLAGQHGLEDGPELRFRVEVALQIADAVLARAFALDASGEQDFVDEGVRASSAYLVAFYGEPAGA